MPFFELLDFFLRHQCLPLPVIFPVPFLNFIFLSIELRDTLLANRLMISVLSSGRVRVGAPFIQFFEQLRIDNPQTLLELVTNVSLFSRALLQAFSADHVCDLWPRLPVLLDSFNPKKRLRFEPGRSILVNFPSLELDAQVLELGGLEDFLVELTKLDKLFRPRKLQGIYVSVTRGDSFIDDLLAHQVPELLLFPSVIVLLDSVGFETHVMR